LMEDVVVDELLLALGDGVGEVVVGEELFFEADSVSVGQGSCDVAEKRCAEFGR